MKSLFVRNPWAFDIYMGDKSVEVRSWSTNYRGPLLVCSSRTAPAEWKDLPCGVSLCVVELKDVVPAERKHARRALCQIPENHFAWILGSPEATEWIEIPGHTSIRDVAADVLKRLGV